MQICKGRNARERAKKSRKRRIQPQPRILIILPSTQKYLSSREKNFPDPRALSGDQTIPMPAEKSLRLARARRQKKRKIREPRALKGIKRRREPTDIDRSRPVSVCTQRYTYNVSLGVYRIAGERQRACRTRAPETHRETQTQTRANRGA